MNDPTRRAVLAAGLGALALRSPFAPASPPPHAELVLYTRPLLRPRHARLVQQALERRAAAHTSGFAVRDGKRVIEIGPVNDNAALWHGAELVKTIARTWPFVAVLDIA